MAQKPLGVPNPARKPGRMAVSGPPTKTRVQLREERTSESLPSPRTAREKDSSIKAPVSIETEQRGVSVVASQVTMAIKEFKSSHKLDGVDYESCKTTASDILSYLSLNELELETAKAFLDILKGNSYKIENSIKKRPAYEHLEVFARKGLKFQSLVPQLKQKVKVCIREHLEKYCISFSEEENASQVKSVCDYQDKITKHKETLKTKQQQLEEKWTEFEEMKCPFVEGYLKEGAATNKKMDEVCACIVDIADIMKKWSHQDRTYPAKLWEEIINGNSARAKLTENLKAICRRRNHLNHHIQKHEVVRDRIARKLDINKKERKKIRSSREVVEDQVERADKDLTDTKEQLQENDLKINQRKSNSPKLLEMLWAKSENLKSEVTIKEERLETYNRQLGRLTKAEEEYNAIVKNQEGEVAEQNYEIKEINDKVEILDKEYAQVHQELQTRGTKIKVAKKIRDMKLDPMTLRKIFYQRMDQQSEDDLSEACRYVSKKIGMSWRGLYQQLPFIPQRDQSKRLLDINLVYVTCLHRDQTLSQQAWQSLLKWRVFNRQKKKVHHSVFQLVRALKRVERLGLARQIEEKYLKPQTT